MSSFTYTSSHPVQTLRRAAGMTQSDLAIRTGLSLTHICRLEAGVLPKRDTPGLQAVADVLGVNVMELRGGRDG